MKKRNLIRNGILLTILTIVIILLIILFNIVTYGKPSSESGGLPSLSLWKPAGNIDNPLNLSENDSAIEKTKEIESPSNLELFKATFKQYWISYVVLFLIVVLLIAWVMIVFKVYNG
jgi:hypothetical protein